MKGLLNSSVTLALQLRGDNFAVLLQSWGYALQSARMWRARKKQEGGHCSLPDPVRVVVRPLRFSSLSADFVFSEEKIKCK